MWKAGQIDGEAGYTYPVALIMLVAIALATQTASIPTSGQMQAEREAELLFRGLAYRDAIASYWKAGGATASLPMRLQDLLFDPRVPGARHIRRLYDDPMPGGGWRTVQGPGGGIVGVFSSAPGSPRQSAFFPGDLSDFENAESYQDWRFIFEPTGG